jgi:hypothetical protein
MQNRKEILSYLDTIALIVVALVFFFFPIIFIHWTSDAFVLPKQIILGAGVLLSLVFFALRTILEGKLRLRATPFDLPVFLFAVVLLASALLSGNRADSIISFIPVLFAVLFYFVIVNVVRGRMGILLLAGALLAGSGLSAILTTLSFFKLYLLPIEYTRVQFFTPLGSLLDQAIVFGVVLPLAAYLAHPMFASVLLHGNTDAVSSKKPQPYNIAFGVGAVIIGIGLIVSLYQLVTSQKPLILPFETGFQTAFASISQDAGRVIQSFLLGSGYGTYLTDFTRFKQASYNANPNLWSFSFFRSSSFVLELLATTGFLGVLSYFFIIFRVVREKWFFLPLMLIIIASVFLPFSYILQGLFFMLLGIFSLIRAQQNPRKYPVTDLYLVALDRGLLSVKPEGEHTGAAPRKSLVLPVIFSLLIFALTATLGYFSVRFILSDMTFQRSLVAAAANNGGATYQLQREAITMFPYRDAYYRVFSQTNLALANNLAAAQPQGASPSAETQQTILTLIQQSINSGRSAVTISPMTSLNWNNLSSVYRSLIGFGENADQFSVLTNQQAIALDPNNPQQYINLGGIYYQLGQWEEAQRNFQIAITLKPDYANAYYNLGHALESKGDLQNALQVYQSVRTLVAKDTESVGKIDTEITALQQKIASGAQTPSGTEVQTPPTEATETPLGVNQPAQQLPQRDPQVKIPGVTVTPLPTGKTSPTPTPVGEDTSPTPGVSVTPSL